MEPLEPFNVIYQTAEDGLGDTVNPRLLEAGADMVDVCGECTQCNPALYHSHRATGGVRGTMGAGIGILY